MSVLKLNSFTTSGLKKAGKRGCETTVVADAASVGTDAGSIRHNIDLTAPATF